MLDCKVDVGALLPQAVEDDLIMSFMMDKSYISISKEESGNLESTQLRKNPIYVIVKGAKNIKETLITAIGSIFNLTFVKTLSFNLFKLQPGYLTF